MVYLYVLLGIFGLAIASTAIVSWIYLHKKEKKNKSNSENQPENEVYINDRS